MQNNLVGLQIGNYRLVSLLGQGGFADTYLGEQLHLKTYAAIKILHTQLSGDDQRRFIDEARVIANLSHPNIVRVLDFGIDSTHNTPYLVMEYAPNGTLRQRYPRGAALPIGLILPHIQQIAAALAYAHSQNIVHRDVKPENMLLGKSNEALLSDFGIAIIAQNTYRAGLADIAGTVTYMAPEQLQGRPQPASDQYALGTVVYEWLCGRTPFTGTYAEVAVQQQQATPPPLRQFVPSIPPDVEQVVLTALAKDIKNRFATIEAFSNALTRAAGYEPQPRPSISSPSLTPVPPSFTPTPPPFNPTPTPQPAPANIVVPPPPATPVTGYGMVAGYGDGLTIPASYPTPTPHNTPPNLPLSANSGSMPPVLPATPLPTPPLYPPPTPTPTPPSMYPQPGSYSQTGAPSPVPQKPGGAKRSPLMIAAITVVVLILLLASGFIYYSSVYVPGVRHVEATATANAQASGTAHANATSAAIAFATTQAENNATATAGAQIQATQTALQNIYTQATTGTPTMNDPLTAGDNYGWDDTTFSAGNACLFTNGAYQASAAKGYTTYCVASATHFNNFALQVDMTVLNGHSGGLIFRVNTNSGSGYSFRLSTDGTYILAKFSTDSKGYIQTTTLISGQDTDSSFNSGNNQKNTIAVVATGSTFYLYINQVYMDQGSDNTYTSGNIGVFADSDTQGVTVSFNNLKLWEH